MRIGLDATWLRPERRSGVERYAVELVTALSRLAPGEIAELAGTVGEMSVPAGGRICAAGDQGDEMFLVRRGRLYALLPELRHCYERTVVELEARRASSSERAMH